jgi:membrane-associated phospholipid phosphatase
MSLRRVGFQIDGALEVRGVSRSGFRHAAANLLRLFVLAGMLLTLWLVRGDAPIWLLGGAVAVSLAAVWVMDRRSGSFGLWAAYFGGFVLFALLRTVADDTGIAVKAGYVVDADARLFGGVLPQQWLQERLYDAETVSALDVLTLVVIFSYFVVPHLVALVLWRRDGEAFRRYCPAFLLTLYAGLAVSAVLPTAPPWAAGQFTDAPPVSRVVAEVMNWNPESLGQGSGSGLNPVAAMPSLHFAVTMLLVFVLWSHRILRWGAMTYAAAMAFALVYGGEHYVVDALAGAATAALAWLAVKKVRLARTAPAPAPPPAMSMVAPASTAD